MRPFLNTVAVPGKVGIEECSLDLIFFYKIRDRRFVFLGEGMFFPTA